MGRGGGGRVYEDKDDMMPDLDTPARSVTPEDEVPPPTPWGE